MMKWELIENTGGQNLLISDRLRVPQGWLLRSVLRGGLSQQVCCAHLLIEDKDHTWSLEPTNSRWKEIDESRPDDFIVSEYLLVPEGWVMRTFTASIGDHQRDGGDDIKMTFISDPGHAWIEQHS